MRERERDWNAKQAKQHFSNSSLVSSRIVSLRLKSVSNIGKITKSMKMIASTKVTKAQRAMEQARVFGSSNVGRFSLLLHMDDGLEGF